jgi:hypothetical protein
MPRFVIGRQTPLKTRTTFARMLARRTVSNRRLSHETARLSPTTEYSLAGTVGRRSVEHQPSRCLASGHLGRRRSASRACRSWIPHEALRTQSITGARAGHKANLLTKNLVATPRNNVRGRTVPERQPEAGAARFRGTACACLSGHTPSTIEVPRLEASHALWRPVDSFHPADDVGA